MSFFVAFKVHMLPALYLHYCKICDIKNLTLISCTIYCYMLMISVTEFHKIWKVT